MAPCPTDSCRISPCHTGPDAPAAAMPFRLEAVEDDARRAALFGRMRREGLAGCAMYAWAEPREEDWLRLVSAPGSLLLQATAPDGAALACGLFSPWRGRVREFDFTVFRPAFPLAVPLARAAFGVVFRQTETSALWGLCPVSNRHAWRLAEACGFSVTGRLPGACWLARRTAFVDGVQVVCTPRSLALARQRDRPAAQSRPAAQRFM